MLAFYDYYQWNPSYARITGFNDEQKLTMGSSSVFGPKVRLYVSPLLSSYTTVAQYASNLLVGMAEVYPNPNGPPQKSYNLNFENSTTDTLLYCIYLAHAGDHWTSAITQFNGNSGCADPTPADALPVDTSVVTGNNNMADFPSVIRFTTDAQQNPSIAVSCLNEVCEIGHGQGLHQAPGASGGFSGSGIRWQVKTWHDEQVLGVPVTHPTPGGPSVAPWADGVVAPVDTLADIKVTGYAQDWRHVARIWVKGGAPSGSTYDKWGLAGGENWVWLRLNGRDWQATFTVAGAGKPNNPAKIFPVTRTNWAPIPVYPTARFVWDDRDDLMWVACDQGCCTVGDIAIQ